MIRREHYLKQLNNNKDKPFIKVLTGLRRVGKSVLLDLFVQDLLDSVVKEDHIFKLNFELPESFNITDFEQLTRMIIEWSENKTGKLYILLDEIGRVKQWEKAVNAFHAMNKFDIYITGSNADLLASDLSTYLAGRYIEILVHPFSYKEFLALYTKGEFSDYLIFGGIPSIAAFNLDYELSMNALRDSFKSAVLQDVILRNNIRNTVVLDKLIHYVFQNTGNTFSALSISKYFKSQRITVAVDTILNYLIIMENAFLIYKVQRNDLIGKATLKTEEKYYIADHGIREAIVGNNIVNIDRILENIVFIELLRRGYKVNIGKVDKLEIDFVAQKGSLRKYYQIAYLMEAESTRNREFGVYKLIEDNFPKYVLSMDKVDFSQDGIIHRNIEDFLLNEEESF